MKKNNSIGKIGINYYLENGFKKDTVFTSQRNIVFKSFYKTPKTMLMVSIETGVFRASICRYLAEFRELGKVKVVDIGICKISKHRANYYSTNPGHILKTANNL